MLKHMRTASRHRSNTALTDRRDSPQLAGKERSAPTANFLLHSSRTGLPVFFKRMNMPIQCVFLAPKLFIPFLFFSCESSLESISLPSLEIEGSSLQKSYVLRDEDVLDI